MALPIPVPKKSVHLPDEPEASPRPRESSNGISSYNSCGNFSRLVRDISPDVITMWREAEPGLRGELVTDEPSTSGHIQAHSKLRQQNSQQRRKQLRSQPEAGSLGRHGPSNFIKLPEISHKPRSLPSSPAGKARPPRHHKPESQALLARASLSGSGTPSFIAGATVAGPLSASVRPSISNTAVTAAALFAVSAGQTLTAASIAYTAGNGTISPPPIGAVSAAAGGVAGASGSGAGGTPETGTIPPPLLNGNGNGSIPFQTSAGGVRGGGNGNGDDGGGLLAADDEVGGSVSAVGGSVATVAALLPGDKKLIEDERLRNRLVSLPNIVCRSANGDVFLVELGNVQAMLHKRELGEEGLAILNRLTPSLAHAIGDGGGGSDGSGHRRRRRTIRINPVPRRQAILHVPDTSAEDAGSPAGTAGPNGATVKGSGGSGGLNRGSSMAAGRRAVAVALAAAALQRGSLGSVSTIDRDPLMEAELERHLAATDEIVQQRRRQLEEDWRRRRIVAANPAAAAKEMEEARRTAAIEFAVRQFVPRRLALMALNMPPMEVSDGGVGNDSGATWGDAHGESSSGATLGAPPSGGSATGAATGSGKNSQSGEPPPPNHPSSPPRQFGADFKVHYWKQLQAGMDRMYDKMPFINNWISTIKKMQRDEHGGWDGLLHGIDDLYVKGREEHQGTNIYVLKCHELGVTPSTQVIQQLSSAEANMSHCNLGRQGAAALRHALSANVTITHLNLQDNHLDATGLESILAGLYSGTMAKQPRARKLLEKRIQTAATTLASAFNAAAGAVAFNAVVANASSTAAAGGNVLPATPSTAPGTAGSAAVARLAASLASPPRRGPPGDLKVRLIPITLAKEQEQRRLAEEARLKREAEEAQRAQSEAARAAAQDALEDGPEWLRLINEFGDGGAHHGAHHVTSHVHLPGLRKSPASVPGQSLNAAHRLTCAITSLDLSNNPLGINGVRALADMLDPTITPYQFLKQLMLNKCGIPEGGGRALAIALSRGNTRLAVLGLSNNSLGNATAAMFGEVLALPSGLEDLDLSWNQIKAEGARALSEGVAQNNTLTRLNLSWNGLENPGVEALGAMLLRNESLTTLDLTNTRMGAEACLMLAEGIRNNHTLEALILNGNSVGDDGARFLMDAIKVNNSLRYLGLQGTNMSTAARGNTQAAAFNPLSPDGAYELNLEVPTDRAVALQLCQMDASAPTDLMRNIKLGDRNISSCKAMHWPDVLPVSGILSCEFVTRRVSKSIGIIEHKKFLALAAQFGSDAMSDKEKLALVEVMAPFNYVLCEQASTLLRSFSIGDEMVLAAALMFARCADLDDNITELTEALGEGYMQEALQQKLGWYSYLRFTNATGHYEFSLSSKVHAALAARLKDVAYSEPVDSLNWHNVIHDQYTKVTKVSPNFGPPEEWKGTIPTYGTLSFDYVSGVLASEKTRPVSNQVLDEVITCDLGIPQDASGRPVPERNFDLACQQVARLRPVVSNMCLTTEQVKKLVEAFWAPPHRVEVLVICYCLIIDRSNLWTIMYDMEPLEQALVMWRLGPANIFDKSHPTGHYVLDLSNPHHETVARKLVDLALANTDLPNFWNVRINGVKRAVNENRNMWGAFITESQTPFMEFDFIGPDGWDVLGRSKAEVEALGPGDRLDIRTKQARRMELSRMKAMYAYYEDGSGWTRPPWQSRQLLMRALQDKAPWQAAWDRLARVLLRCEVRRGGVDGESPVEDLFYSTTAGEDAMTAEQFESLMKEWGYNKLELTWMCDSFDAEARPANLKDGPAYKPIAVKPSSPPGSAATDISLQPPAATLTGSPGRAGNRERASRQQSQVIGAMATAAVASSGAASGSATSPSIGSGSYDTPSPSRNSRMAGTTSGSLEGPQRSAGSAAAAASVAAHQQLQQQHSQQQQQQFVPNLVVEFPAFVNVFMRYPPKVLKGMHSATSAVIDGVELATRPSRKSAVGKGR